LSADAEPDIGSEANTSTQPATENKLPKPLELTYFDTGADHAAEALDPERIDRAE